ncbi:MAG: polyprenol monophosphomannose synthase [Fibrobacterales bacterium]
MPQNPVLIIIPTYNERENIQTIIPLVHKYCSTADILVVDDGSPDGTAEVVKKMQIEDPTIHILEREGKLGLGSAYIAGFKYALKEHYEYVFEMDADLSHDPKHVPDFLKAAEKSDLVLGSRYKDGKISVVNWDWKRLVLSYMGNIYARLVSGMPISDATGGYKCFSRKALQALNLDRISSGGYSFQIEMTYKLWKKGFSIAEVPIIFTDRIIGESKISGQIIREALFVLIKLRLGRN